MKSGGTSGIATNDPPRAFLALTEPKVGPDGRFGNGRTVAELQARCCQATRAAGRPGWDSALLVLHGLVNKRDPVTRAGRRHRLLRPHRAQPGLASTCSMWGRTTG